MAKLPIGVSQFARALDKLCKKYKKQSVVKKDLRTLKYRQRIEKPKRGRGSFRRKERGTTSLE